MLRGDKAGLRARHDSDVMMLQSQLYDDVATRVRADSRPWRPIPPNSNASPYRVAEPADDVAFFSVVDLTDGDCLAGEALLWGIDLHNRSAHLGIALLPEFRGRAFGTDVLRVLCHYGFALRGMQRLQIETLIDNEGMIRAAIRVGFTQEGVLRRAAWVDGAFVDEVVLGLLAQEWSRAARILAPDRSRRRHLMDLDPAGNAPAADVDGAAVADPAEPDLPANRD